MRYGVVAPALCRSLVQNQRLRVQLCNTGLRKLSSLKSSPRSFEEEQIRNYNPKDFYPAHIGDTLNGKYELLSKLGWGTGSTVWLARINHW
jgi:hypothetical protein